MIVIDGMTSDGTQLGLWTLIFALAAALASLPAIGLFGRDEHMQWLWSAITAGLSAGVVLISTAWIATQVRSADPNFVSGIGSFLALSGGFFLLASTMGVLREFRRSKVYGDVIQGELPVAADVDETAEAVDAAVGVS